MTEVKKRREMEKVKRFFKEIRWFEYLFLAVCLAILIALCVVYKSSVPTALSSTLGVVSVFFITKGNVVGQIIGLVQLPFYAYISYVNKLYGEMIICFLISFPLYIIAVISWLRNLNSKGAVGSVKVNIDLSLKEWLIVLVVGAIFGVGVYFLLGYFNPCAFSSGSMPGSAPRKAT